MGLVQTFLLLGCEISHSTAFHHFCTASLTIAFFHPKRTLYYFHPTHTKWIWRPLVGKWDFTAGPARVVAVGWCQVCCVWQPEGAQALSASEPLPKSATASPSLPHGPCLSHSFSYSLWSCVFSAVNSMFHNKGRKPQCSDREERRLPSTLTITDFWLCPASPCGLKTSQV